MALYTISARRTTGSEKLIRTAQRSRIDAAHLMADRMMYELVEGNGGLDTPSGVRAILAVRAAANAGEREFSIPYRDMKVSVIRSL